MRAGWTGSPDDEDRSHDVPTPYELRSIEMVCWIKVAAPVRSAVASTAAALDAAWLDRAGR